MYRVLIGFRAYPFNDYEKALMFQKQHGGTVYIKTASCKCN